MQIYNTATEISWSISAAENWTVRIKFSSIKKKPKQKKKTVLKSFTRHHHKGDEQPPGTAAFIQTMLTHIVLPQLLPNQVPA